MVDGSFNTIYSSPNEECFIGLDVGEQMHAKINRITFVPNPRWPNAASKLEGGVFEGSLDGYTYEEIFKIDTSLVHSGYNVYIPETPIRYRQVRFRHNNLSSCELAEIELHGVILTGYADQVPTLPF